MKIKFPLFARILFWFFLNVVLVVLTFYIIARFQFHFGLDSLIAGRAGERVHSVTEVIFAELRDSPRSEWSDVLKRFSDAYGVRFVLFRNDGEQLAGEPVPLPPEIRNRIVERRPNPPFRQPVPGRPVMPGFGAPQQVKPPMQRPEPPAPRVEPPQRFMMHTDSPRRYWVFVHNMLPEPDRQRPAFVTLLVMSESLSAGGLFFDPTPWLLGAAAVIVISTLVWLPLVRGITRSISQMTHATEQIAEGQFDVRAPQTRSDELGSLGEAINRMAVRLAGFVTGQKRFTGDVAHELCSPLARMQMALSILEQRGDPKQAEYLKDLREEVEHMSNLVNELLSFSKASLGKAAIQLQPVSLRAVAEKAANRESSGSDATIKIEIPEKLEVLAEPELLSRAIGNVLRNAIRYAGAAGPIILSAMCDQTTIVLSIEDCGPGIPEESIGRVFDPFYRLDTSRARETGGVGLGLSIVKTCVEACGGTVRCENRVPSGLRVLMRLQSAK